jgi:hypothetical protein
MSQAVTGLTLARIAPEGEACGQSQSAERQCAWRNSDWMLKKDRGKVTPRCEGVV